MSLARRRRELKPAKHRRQERQRQQRCREQRRMAVAAQRDPASVTSGAVSRSGVSPQPAVDKRVVGEKVDKNRNFQEPLSRSGVLAELLIRTRRIEQILGQNGVGHAPAPRA